MKAQTVIAKIDEIRNRFPWAGDHEEDARSTYPGREQALLEWLEKEKSTETLDCV